MHRNRMLTHGITLRPRVRLMTALTVETAKNIGEQRYYELLIEILK